MSHSKKILFIFSGSIAVYKAVTLLSRLVQRGYDVQCVLTASALKFIGRATIEGLTGKSIHSDLYDSDNVMGHIHLIRDADAVIVAPATANFINKIANGIGDDLASTLFLAHDFKKPFLVAPAMNTKMYEHPQTQGSLKKLKSQGITILESGSGILACGEVGYGKLLEPEIMIVEIEKILSNTSALGPTKNVNVKSNVPRILITGGGTVEKIDDVRSITNFSSGETAISIAKFFYDLGLAPTLIVNNQKSLPIPSELKNIPYSSFSDLNSIMKKELSENHYDFVIHAAAVSDFSIDKIEGYAGMKVPKKISSGKAIKLVLKPNFKIISKLSQYSKNKKIKIIGFKLTSHASEKQVNEAVARLFDHNRVQYVVQNDISEIDKEKGIHHFYFFRKGHTQPQRILSTEHLRAHLAEIITEESI